MNKLVRTKSETLLVPLKPPSCKECDLFQSKGGERKNCKRFEDEENHVAWIVYETVDKNGSVKKRIVQDF